MNLKTTNHCWKKIKTQISGNTSYIHGSERLKLLGWHYFPNWSIDSMKFLLKCQLPILQKFESLSWTLYGNAKDPELTKKSWKEESWWTNSPNFKTYYKTKVIKTLSLWHKDRYTGQWAGVESPEIDSYIYSQLIFAKVSKQLNGQRIVFSTDGFGMTGYPSKKWWIDVEPLSSHYMQKLHQNEP